MTRSSSHAPRTSNRSNPRRSTTPPVAPPPPPVHTYEVYNHSGKLLVTVEAVDLLTALHRAKGTFEVRASRTNGIWLLPVRAKR